MMCANRPSSFSYQNNLKFSQNFLTNTRLLKDLVALSTLSKKDTVIEIGTGKGHLTRVLCETCQYLYSIELDPVLYEKAVKRLSETPNLELIHGDFLKFALPQDIDYSVFANIPYFITTKIVEKLTQAPHPPKDIWLTMEQSAAKRFMGLPRENKKSLRLKVCWNAEILHTFKAEDFHPKPKVKSVLIHFSRKDTPDLDKSDFHEFLQFLDHSLKFGLFSKKSLLTKKQISRALNLEGLPTLRKHSHISYAQWLCLFKCWQRFRKV